MPSVSNCAKNRWRDGIDAVALAKLYIAHVCLFIGFSRHLARTAAKVP